MRTAARWWAVALAWAVAPAVLTAAPAAPTSDKDKADTPVEKLRKELDKTITVKIDHQPLSAAVDMLKEKTKVNFVLDGMTIQNTFGWTVDQPPTPVDVDLKDVKLKSALRTVLSPYSLSYAIVGDTIVITTEDMALGRVMRQRVNVEFDKMEFAAALKQLQRETAVNLLLDSRVEKEAKAPVSLELEDVPLETAVRLLSEMAGLKPVRVGTVLFVTKKETANELRNDPDLTQPGNPGGQPPIPVNPPPPGVFFPPGGPGGPPVAVPGAPAPPAVAPPAVPADPKDTPKDGDKPADKGDHGKDKDKTDSAPEKKDDK